MDGKRRTIMDFRTLVESARSIRRFKQIPVSMTSLETLIDYARISPCSANQQRLKYMAVNDQERMDLIFPLINWAGALKEWDGPVVGERPTAYIVILLDKDLGANAGVDHGIAAQTIQLGARSMGLGACIIGAYNRSNFSETIGLPDTMEPLFIIALGEAGEEVMIDAHKSDGSIAYYRDAEDKHHVPKRPLEEVLWTGRG